MGRGKKRNTAKTGDKSLYKKAAANNNSADRKSGSSNLEDDNNDSMYDKVDRYHNEQNKNFLKFDDDNNGSSDDSGDEKQEAVMDLGAGGDSSSDEDDDDSSSSDDDNSDDKNAIKTDKQQLESSDDDHDDDDDDQEEIEDVRNWGKRKSAYYHGDTADLELGQDEEDAFLEEEAAKEVQAARLEEMKEEDFMLSDDEDEKDKSKVSIAPKDEKDRNLKIASIRDVSKLSSKDRRKLLEKQHPGLLQILSHFSEAVRDLEERTSVATRALFAGDNDDIASAVGATKLGKKYLLTKALIQSSTALNLAMFLLLKSEEATGENDNDSSSLLLVEPGTSSLVQFHPVMKRLQEMNVLGQKLKIKVEDNVDGLDEQLESLIKASKLMESLADDDDGDDGEEAEKDSDAEVEMGDTIAAQAAHNVQVSAVQDESLSSSDSQSSEDEEAIAKATIQNARFGLRPNEVAQENGSREKRRRRAAPLDLGDDDDNAKGDHKGAARYLSSTLNTIQQRTASRKKKRSSASEELVDQTEADDDLRRGLDMMEAELGKASDDEGEVASRGDSDDDDDGDGGYYSTMTKKSKTKKELKKSLYKVAPKYPRLEGEVEGERAISRTIMKNRGLVPHKNKLNRNPRVKKREQYRKALIKRKGAVREVRTDEGHRYGGEETGIKRGISRSRKLGVK